MRLSTRTIWRIAIIFCLMVWAMTFGIINHYMGDRHENITIHVPASTVVGQ